MEKEKYTQMQDIENDWLSREKAREGYRKGKTSAEIAHHEEEKSFSWNSGAIANAREHYSEHDKVHGIETKTSKMKIGGLSKENENFGDVSAFTMNVFSLFALAFITFGLQDYFGPYIGIPFAFLFFSLNPGIFIWLLIFRRFPPKKYSKICLIVTFALFAYFVLKYGN